MSNTENKVVTFIKRISEHAQRFGGGQIGIDPNFLRQLVIDDPDTAAAVVWAYCEMAQENPSLFQLATTVAAIYQEEFDDDSLILEVQQAQQKPSTKTMPPIRVLSVGQQPQEAEVVEVSHEPLRVLQVELKDLKAGNISTFVRLFSLNEANQEKLRDLSLLKNKLLISFPVDDDPRPVEKIPEVRHFIQKLHKAIPYFSYFLDFRPEFGMFSVYFGCLADHSALLSDGNQLNLIHDSVIGPVIESLLAVGKVSRQLNEDPSLTWQAILSVYPSDVANHILLNLKQH